MKFGLKFTGLAFAMACYASFMWAARIYFGRAGGVTKSQKWILASMYATATLHACAILYMNHGTIYHFVTGVALYTLSFLLFWSAAAAARKTRLQLFFSHILPDQLVSHGPYRLVRHPFYVSYTIAWIAGVIIVDQPWLIISVLFCLWLYDRAARLEEAGFQKTPLAIAYIRYSAEVGRFCPRIPSFSVLQRWFLNNIGRSSHKAAATHDHPGSNAHFAVARVPAYQTVEAG